MSIFGIAPMWNMLVRWPVGMVVASVRYSTQSVPVHRVEEHEVVIGPELPARYRAGVQTPDDGVGPLFHRRYRVRVGSSLVGPEQLMRRLTANPNEAVAAEVALFDFDGDHSEVRLGAEFVVRMPGPWDGPVRVVHTTPTSFRLATLWNHLEAGQIEFHAYRDHDELVFEIESWARSGDWLANVLYDGLSLSKEVQIYMWAQFCERVCALVGGRIIQGVEVYTGREG